MHLCFATPWRTSWIPLYYVFLYGWNTHLIFNALLLLIIGLCYFSCYNMVAKFYYQDYVFYAHVRVLWSQHSMFYILWSRLCWCMLIHLKCIYNFWCSMLVYTPFALCFVSLRGIFMHFPELTYWWDATVPVPYFLLSLCFRKATQVTRV
jgi:hypothetical protein